MDSAFTAICLYAGLTAMVLLGRMLRQRLPDTHLNSDSRDAIKLAMGLVATMTALLLGLLVSSAKGTYDTQRAQVIQMAGKATFLGRVLSTYGAEASTARLRFREAIEEGVRRIWTKPGHDRLASEGDVFKGDVFFAAIHDLRPTDDTQRALKNQAASLAMDLGQLRMLLHAQSVPSIPQPLLITVMIWLGVTFLAFSLLSPPNATTLTSLLTAALSVAAAIFLILELDQPLSGSIRISSAPITQALANLNP